MQREHLTYEELEQYADETDLSEEYLCWSEPITEHLDTCALCRERLEKLFLISELWTEGNMAAAIGLAGREEELRRQWISLRLELVAKEQRVLEVARRLQRGMLVTLSATKAEILRGQSVTRSEVSKERPVSVYYEDGKLYVMVELPKEADVAVVLVQTDKKNAPPEMQAAKWEEDRKMAIAEFEIGELLENYEAYVDIQDV